MASPRKNHGPDPLHGGKVHVPRSRGAVSGMLLVALGGWGALIPFIGPWFNFAFTPNVSWNWTAARWWLEVLPGIAVFIGGLFLLLSANRITASIGGWFAVAGGAWFAVGTNFATLFHLGSPGRPAGGSESLRVIESLAFFDGLGVLIAILASLAIGRLSIRSVRDVRNAQRREVEEEIEQRRQAEYAESRRIQLVDAAPSRESDGRPPRNGHDPNSDESTDRHAGISGLLHRNGQQHGDATTTPAESPAQSTGGATALRGPQD